MRCIPSLLVLSLAGPLALGAAAHPQLDGAELEAPGIEHVLVVSMDTTRRDRLGFHGGSASTPALDRIASEGTVFESAFAPTPVTLPSHATLFTGTYPPRHGVRDNAIFRLGPEALTLAEALRAAGMRTAAVVSAFVLDAQFGLDQGFESYDDRFQSGLGGMMGLEERSATQATDAALRWLDARPEGRFFLFVHYFDPHHPYAAPEPYASAAAHPYDAEIAYMDAEIGRLVAALRARELLERTLLVVTADHGESLGEHGEPTHGAFVYQSTMAIPLVFRGPGIEGGRRIPGNVSLADVAPTILALLGLPVGDAVQGQSLAPALLEGNAVPERDIYLESWVGRYSFGWAPLAAIVSGSTKYVSAPRPELYDLAADPGETKDLVEEQSGRARTMQRRFELLLARLEVQEEPWARGHALSDEERARLESIGYVSSARASESSGRDPKDGISELGLLEQAGAAHERGEFERALELYEKILEANPANYAALERSGTALVNLERYDEAIERLERSRKAELFPGLSTFNLAYAYARTEREERALEIIRDIRARNAKFMPAHLFQAQYHEARGEEREAIEAYETLLQNWHGAAAFRENVERRIRALRKD